MCTSFLVAVFVKYRKKNYTLELSRYDTNVFTLEMPKSYGVVYNKCIVMDDYTTLPYGF